MTQRDERAGGGIERELRSAKGVGREIFLELRRMASTAVAESEVERAGGRRHRAHYVTACGLS